MAGASARTTAAHTCKLIVGQDAGSGRVGRELGEFVLRKSRAVIGIFPRANNIGNGHDRIPFNFGFMSLCTGLSRFGSPPWIATVSGNLLLLRFSPFDTRSRNEACAREINSPPKGFQAE